MTILSTLATSIKGFVSNPLRCLAVAGLAFGAQATALGVVLVVMAFHPALAASATAVVVAPLIANLALATLGLCGVVALTFLGFRKVSASFAGATIEIDATTAKATVESVLDDFAAK